jgi:hypothetical protein
MKHSSSKKVRDPRPENVTTTDPLTASAANDVEFTDSPGVNRIFTLKRGHLYLLEQEGLIKGVSLRRRGAARGKKLWDVGSIRRYLAAQMKDGK